jgi:septum formation protein
MKQLEKIILASASPRRKELLENLGLKLTVSPSDVAEDGFAGSPETIASKIVVQKMKAAIAKLGNDMDGYVLAADTIVVLGLEIFGKPENADHARSMLLQLSGKVHQVYTCFRIENSKGDCVEKTVCTHVKMKTITPGMLQWYLSTQEPFGKAGSYAIQGYGGVLVEKIEGSYTNVVGLPMAEVMDALIELKVIAFP